MECLGQGPSHHLQASPERYAPLEPGETQQFRMAFDNVPEYWNQAFPSLFISQIQFAAP